MEDGDDPVQAVLSSAVRADVLRAVADGTRTTNDLLAAVDASSSATYNAIGRLEDAGLLAPGEDGWQVTGTGRLVADCVILQQRLSRLLEDAGEYFAAHDTSVLPVEYRFRLSDLAGGRVLRATETEPQRVVREVTELLEDASRARTVTPIYVESFVSTAPYEEGTRMVLTREVLDTMLEGAPEGGGDVDVEVRLADAGFSMAVTESTLLLSLPTLDGRYDPQTEFVAEHDRALRWGERLFDAIWEEAEPVADAAD